MRTAVETHIASYHAVPTCVSALCIGHYVYYVKCVEQTKEVVPAIAWGSQPSLARQQAQSHLRRYVCHLHE